VKFRGRLGLEMNDCRSIRVLNRVVRWTEPEIIYGADQMHTEIIVARVGLRGKRNVVTPGVKVENQKDEDKDDGAMCPGGATVYRGLVTRDNYLSADRLDIKYSLKELSKWISAPRNKDRRKLIRLVGRDIESDAIIRVR
jgi:hypothetical protein